MLVIFLFDIKNLNKYKSLGIKYIRIRLYICKSPGKKIICPNKTYGPKIQNQIKNITSMISTDRSNLRLHGRIEEEDCEVDANN